MEQRYPKIGLALGSGAAKAVCQLGILKGLVENNIKIGYIMGSSMGAIVGGIYALGLDLDETISKSIHYANTFNVTDFGNINFFHESLFKKDFSKNMLKEIFGELTFEDCKIPFAVTAVDLESGQEILLNRGYLWEAIRASTSIPGLFSPVFLDGRYLVDGGMLEDTPVTSMRRYTDCDLIVGSAINDLKNRQFISGAVFQKFYKKPSSTGFFKDRFSKMKTDFRLFTGIISRSVGILRDELFKYKLAEAKPDLLLTISTDDVSIFDFKKAPYLISLGEKAFNSKLPVLLKLIERKIKELNDEGKDVNLEEHNDGGWSTN